MLAGFIDQTFSAVTTVSLMKEANTSFSLKNPLQLPKGPDQ
jgi:hypothetical protein